MTLEMPPEGHPASTATEIASTGASIKGTVEAIPSVPTAGKGAAVDNTSRAVTSPSQANKGEEGDCKKPATHYEHHKVHHTYHAEQPPAPPLPFSYPSPITTTAPPREYTYQPQPPLSGAPGDYYSEQPQPYYAPPPVMPSFGLAIGGLFGRLGFSGFHGWGGGWRGGVGLQIGLGQPYMPFYSQQQAFYPPPGYRYAGDSYGYGGYGGGYGGVPYQAPFASAAYEQPYNYGYAPGYGYGGGGYGGGYGGYGGGYGGYGGGFPLPMISAGFPIGGRRGGFLSLFI